MLRVKELELSSNILLEFQSTGMQWQDQQFIMETAMLSNIKFSMVKSKLLHLMLFGKRKKNEKAIFKYQTYLAQVSDKTNIQTIEDIAGPCNYQVIARPARQIKKTNMKCIEFISNMQYDTDYSLMIKIQFNHNMIPIYIIDCIIKIILVIIQKIINYKTDGNTSY